MAKLNPESFTFVLQDLLMDRLKSVILYGSAAAGDYLGRSSDFNLLVVTSQLGLEELTAVSEASRKWIRQGNPPPLMFTTQRLQQSADVFPIELLDIQQSRKVLFGDDVIADLQISKVHLRHQIEYELKSKLIKLREGYIVTSGKESQLLGLLMESLSPFQTMIKASLRLMQTEAPPAKRDATEVLGRKLGFDPRPFRTIEQLKAGQRAPREVNAHDLFADYLTQIEIIVDAVDGLEFPVSS